VGSGNFPKNFRKSLDNREHLRYTYTMNKNKRPQAQKVRRNSEKQREVLELRRSNAAQPHRSGTEYARRPKHMGRGWE
jgi:hypothetical protein